MALAFLASARAGAAPTSAQAPSPSVRLPSHVLGALSSASRLSRSPSASGEPVTLTLVLNRSDPAAFDAYLRDVQDPHSASFQHFASQSDLRNRYGPSQQSYDALLAFLQANGFTLVLGSANRLTITVQGTRSQAEKAFGVQIDDYQLGSRRFYANDQDPSLPAGIAPAVAAVVGLSNLAVPHPNVAVTPTGTPTPQTAPAPTPMALAQAYNAGALGADGTGQKIGLLEYDTYNPSDIASWLNAVGLPSSLAGHVSQKDIGTPVTVLNENLGEIEVVLDIDTVLGMAQGATIVAYDSCGNQVPSCTVDVDFAAFFNAMIDDGDTAISASWGYCENSTTQANLAAIDSVLQAAAASGVGVFVAAGDLQNVCPDGTAAGALGDPDVPAGAPNATAVGGTTLQVAADGTYQGESWWTNGQAEGGGFGASTFYPRPNYQLGFTTSATRSLPDVSADADPRTGLRLYEADLGGLICCVGGTSMAAPQWAAGMALVDEKLGHLTGNLNAAFYSLAATTAFHPPGGMPAPGNDFAHLGLGSFNLGDLATALGLAGSGVTGTLKLTSIACPSNTCYAVGADSSGAGAVVPVIGGAAGSVQTVAGTGTLSGIACPAGSICDAVGQNNAPAYAVAGALVPITAGAAGSAQTVAGTSALFGIACSTTNTCEAVGTNASSGVLVPITGGNAGSAAAVSGTFELFGIACPTSSACDAVGTNSASGAFVPISSGSAGSAQLVAGTSMLFSITCPSGDTCYSVGLNGPALEAGCCPFATVGVVAPIANGAVGGGRTVVGTIGLYGVACPGSTCDAVGQNGPRGSEVGVIAPFATPLAALRLGDVNGDGRVTSVDALCVLRMVVGLAATTACPQPPPGNPIIASGEASGPTSVDALCILRGVAGLPVTSSCPQIPAP